MIPMPAFITARDVQQWIAGGICLLDETTPVGYVTARNSSITVRTVDTHTDVRVTMDEIGRISTCWPKCGSLNVPGGAIYLMRRQAQQYRRTYNPRVLAVVYPDKWAILKADPEFIRKFASPMQEDIIREAFNPVYPSWDGAMLALANDPFVALNEQIILGGTPENLTVYHKGRKCGTVLDGVFSSIGRGLQLNRAYKLLQGRITVC